MNFNVIRVHEANAVEERRVYLANRQSEIIDSYVEKLRVAKELGVETDQFMRLTGMQNGGFAGSTKTTKVEIPEWVKDQSFESWKKEFETYFDKFLGKYKGKTVKVENQDHPDEIRVELEEKVRLDMIAMLKKCENESVKNFFSNSIVNNNEVKETYQKIMDKLEDRYGVSQNTKDSIARKELYNFEYTGKCTDIVDKMERLRKKVHASITCDSAAKDAQINVMDKFMFQDFLEKMKDLNRINSNEYRRMTADFKTKKLCVG
jgi:acetolactate synthase small subunit